MRGKRREENSSVTRQAATNNIDKDLELLSSNCEILPIGSLQEKLKENRPLRIKLGIDPTGANLHLGHAVVLKKLRQFQDLGHQVVLIIGDYTTLIGDPTGRDKTRPLLDEDKIKENAALFEEQAFKILDKDKTEVRFNSEWLHMDSKQLFSLLQKFTVKQLLEREDFKKRLNEDKPISALEILYPLLQGYDSVQVDADVEIGAKEQLFNLFKGRDMQGEFGKSEKEQQSVLMMPILVGLDGTKKMGKSDNNFVALEDDPKNMYGKIMSIPDHLMDEYYRLLLLKEKDNTLTPRQQKGDLARQIVEEFHGQEKAQLAEEAFVNLFKKKEIPDNIPELCIDKKETHLPQIISEQFNISKNEARRLIDNGACSLNGEKIAKGNYDLTIDEDAVLKVGKRKFLSLKV